MANAYTPEDMAPGIARMDQTTELYNRNAELRGLVAELRAELAAAHTKLDMYERFWKILDRVTRGGR